ELEQCQAVGTEVVEQFGITHHAAHGSCASIGHEVVGGLLGLALDGSAGNVATHGDTGDVDLVRLGQRTAVLPADPQPIKSPRQPTLTGASYGLREGNRPQRIASSQPSTPSITSRIR